MFQDLTRQINQALTRYLPPIDTAPLRLHQAMHYVVTSPGKRIRALLVHATGQLFGANTEDLDRAASAVEFIHAYSLAHDDLPAMDDDDLRRGKPTCHKAFDDATAILVGDALQCLAFDILVEPYQTNITPETRLKMLFTLTQACGSLGMAGGQALDLEATTTKTNLTGLAQIHHRKTGALINASVKLGMLAANNHNPMLQNHLNQFATNIGLAFQIHDDILDIISPTDVLGKTQGQDIAQNKATYPELMGLEAAITERDQVFQQAIDHLSLCGDNTEQLIKLAEYIVERRH